MDLAAQHRQVATCAPRRTHSHVWGTGRWGSARRRSSFHRWTFWVWGRTLGQLLLGVGVLRVGVGVAHHLFDNNIRHLVLDHLLPRLLQPALHGPREASFLRTSLPSCSWPPSPARDGGSSLQQEENRQATMAATPQLVSAHNRFQAFSAHPTNLKATGKELQIYSHAGP